MSRLLVILLAGFSCIGNASDYYRCSYLGKRQQGMIEAEKCLYFVEGTRHPITGGDGFITRSVATRSEYDENGLSYLYSSVGVFYFNEAGLVRRTLMHDNGPDYFRDGLARTEWQGKIGFFDKALTIVIEPRYDFAFPFENGIAVICNGCTKQFAGEHAELAGGLWGAIDTKGEFVHPIDYSKSELEARLQTGEQLIKR
jgi:hypothetical protein